MIWARITASPRRYRSTSESGPLKASEMSSTKKRVETTPSAASSSTSKPIGFGTVVPSIGLVNSAAKTVPKSMNPRTKSATKGAHRHRLLRSRPVGNTYDKKKKGKK